MIIPAGRGDPSQVEGALIRQGLQVERLEGQGDEAGALQTSLDLGVPHEELPYPLRAIVLDHDHHGPLVNSQLIGVVPTRPGVKRVAETIGSPNARTGAAIEGAQSRH